MVKVIAAVAVAAVLGLYGGLKWWSQFHVVDAAFWFEDVTFELPHLSAGGFGGALTAEEQRTIQAVARDELRHAFDGLRIRFSDDRDAHYAVRVLQQFAGMRGTGAAGASRVLRPLGGAGAVNFLMLGSQAISHAPADAGRSEIVEAIGRGIGRAAVHEFAHQLVPHVQLHDTDDAASYEFSYSSRPAQYYGTMHWDTAWPALMRKLGPQRRPSESGNVPKHQDPR